MFRIGQKIEIIDKITENYREATIMCIEADNEIPNLFWLYLLYDDATLNTKYDPKIGYFGDIIESDSMYISSTEY